MKKMFQGGLFVLLALVFGAALTMWQGNGQPAFGGGDKSSGPHYTVIETHGHNLLVTDNATNKVYFYTTDKDAPIGSPLKLRASLNLSQIGQAEIKITDNRPAGK